MNGFVSQTLQPEVEKVLAESPSLRNTAAVFAWCVRPRARRFGLLAMLVVGFGSIIAPDVLFCFRRLLIILGAWFFAGEWIHALLLSAARKQMTDIDEERYDDAGTEVFFVAVADTTWFLWILSNLHP